MSSRTAAAVLVGVIIVLGGPLLLAAALCEGLTVTVLVPTRDESRPFP
jgi:hypothetical protein